MENQTTRKRGKCKSKDEQPSKRLKTAYKEKENNSDEDLQEPSLRKEWEIHLLADNCNIGLREAGYIIEMFEDDCTIPFIARYRGDKTGNMDANTLRYIKESYMKIKNLETKVKTVLSNVKKCGKMTMSLENSIMNVSSFEELEHIYAPYKPGAKRTKAEKARELGLEKIATDVLEGNDFERNLFALVNPSKDGLKNVEDIYQGIKHIIADIISKDRDVLNHVQSLVKEADIVISSNMKVENKKTKNAKEDVNGKFQTYYNFKCSIKNIKPYQVLALNRGERSDILSLKFSVPELLNSQLQTFCLNKWLRKGKKSEKREKLFKDSYNDSYQRLIQPLIIRRIRSQLNEKAEHAGIESFASNLKNLLLTNPIRGCAILGIDPGFHNGCKMALVSASGTVLWTYVLKYRKEDSDGANIIKQALVENRCELIAIGNGCGSREIEEYISTYIKNGFFGPDLSVRYTIVNERGSSVYSCSPIAKEEFPHLEPVLISAVFIARSIQDPISELVKVEPKSLGVGMYQHDMPDKQLNNTLDEIVSECVSFVGVDLNTASLYLLRRVSGLNKTLAQRLIDWRNKYGSFSNRQQLISVKGIGPKIFQQCSGFLRVIPETAKLVGDEARRKSLLKKTKSKKVKSDINLLDRTWIHPEIYESTYKFLDICNVNLTDIGSEQFIDEINQVVNSRGLESISKQLDISEQCTRLIVKALTEPIDYDYRSQFSKPLFRSGCTCIEDLRRRMRLKGCVSNMTDFGAFTDIGVGTYGLIHNSKMRQQILNVGDRVEIEVLNVDVLRKRISLQLISIIDE